MDDTLAGSGAEKNAERLTALSDGIFAIAMTLLVLDVRIPPGLSTDGFREAFIDVLPDLGAYALSFWILAGFWRDHRRIVRMVPPVEKLPLRFALVWLGAIALIPFPTSLLSEYADQPLAVSVYAGTVCVTNLLELAVLRTSLRGSGPHGRTTQYTARSVSADLVCTAAVFAVSVPLAYGFSTPVALWSWLVLAPAKIVLNRRYPDTPPPVTG
ncbi:TMEM175 family protein [Streptomyces sp. NPDC001822]|uniref:TMEM175 family protein n=1 Tax=Streptomyces sp. NPDC001822 TaxID=3364614 RepID=UPI0036B29FF8